MKWSWFRKKPELFEKIKDQIKNEYPALVVFIKKNTVYIRGNLQLLDESKKRIIDRFAIEIELPAKYPNGLPKVRELNGRIPKIADRHINEDDEDICLFLPDERYKHYPEGASIIDFIKGPVVSYFLGQVCYEQTGKLPTGERSHGIRGIIEFYSEELKVNDVSFIKRFLEYLSKPRLKGHWPCYCGSGKKMRHCHLNQILKYRNEISVQVATASLKRLSQARFNKTE